MTDDQKLAESVLNSIAHGAGRRLNRSTAEEKMSHKYKNSRNLLKTKLDSLVVCDNKKLLYQEAPEAYKNIDDVICDLEEEKIIKVVAILCPLLTYK